MHTALLSLQYESMPCVLFNLLTSQDSNVCNTSQFCYNKQTLLMLEWEKRLVGGEGWKPRAHLPAPPMESLLCRSHNSLNQLVLEGARPVMDWSGMNKKQAGALFGLCRVASPKTLRPQRHYPGSPYQEIFEPGRYNLLLIVSSWGNHPSCVWNEGCSSTWLHPSSWNAAFKVCAPS